MNGPNATAQIDLVSGSLISPLGKDAIVMREDFTNVPMLSGDAVLGASWTSANTRLAIANAFKANRNFILGGTSAVGGTAAVLNASGLGGISLVCKSGTGRTAFVFPSTLAAQSNWNLVKWLSSKQVVFETLIKTGPAASLLLAGFQAGLTLTTAVDKTTDADQIKFWFNTADNAANLYIAYSIGGTDYLVDTGVDVAADTDYLLQIAVQSDRTARCYVNGVMVHQTANALTTAIAFKPTAGVTNLTTATKTLQGPRYFMCARAA